MASLHRDRQSGNYRVRFRYQGRQVNRSLQTKSEREARASRDRLEESLELVRRGRVAIPTEADPIAFLLSDGHANHEQHTGRVLGLSEFFATYQQRLPKGRKEESTLQGEKIHVTHLKRLLGPNRAVQSVGKTDLQQYVAKRLRESFRGRLIQPDTVRKELVTFRMLWNWGVEEGLLSGRSPTKHVVLPLTDEKPPFMTQAEIKAIIGRGGLSELAERELWKALFLERDEIDAVLDHVRESARAPFVYPMLVLVAHTGARRSEMVRARIEDLDFRSRTVLIREKKKSRTKATTFRRVDMSPLVERVMRNWIANHPGGQQVFCQTRLSGHIYPITGWQADHHLRRTFAKGDWQIIRGFHVFRHSFASNLAMAGVADKIIDEWMGHQTAEMRQRYRHLFPRARRSAIDAAFGD